MRINNVLNILKNHLATYDDLTPSDVEIKNLADEKSLSKDTIILCLVKAEEERVLRNGKHAKLNQDFKMVFKNRPVYTNCYVMLACNHGNYGTALSRLSQVVEYFQGKNVFTHLDGQDDSTGEKFKLVLELEMLSFEQINYIWGFYGGKQLPSVMYKVRLFPIEARDKQNAEGEPLLELNIDSKGTN